MNGKLRLDVEALRVDTFVPQERPTVRGTVNGHDDDDVNYSTLPACSAAAGCQTGAAACTAAGCGSDNASCQTACMTTPCCPSTPACPPA